MSKKTVLKASALALAIAAAPSAALAEVSGSLGISSNYLWRGQQLFTGGVVHGSIDYGMENGLYAGAWTSSESGRTEYDLYVGFGGELDGGITYDISYIDYNYTGGGTGENGGDSSQSGSDFEEVHLGLGVAGFGFDVFIGVGDYGHNDNDDLNADGEQDNNGDNYYAISYGVNQISAVLGMYDFDGDPEDPETDASNFNDYTHLDVSYAITDQLTFTVSKVIDQDETNGVEQMDDDVVMQVSYGFAF